jgi:hypothetical protein
MKRQVLWAGAAVGAVLLVGGAAFAQMGGHGMGRDGVRSEESSGRGSGQGHGMGRGHGMEHGGRHGMGHGMRGETQHGGGHGRMGQSGHDGRGHDGRGHGMGRGRASGQGAGPGPGGQGGMQAFAQPAQIETLKREIGITAAQEPAWNEYVKALEETASTVRALREGIDREAVPAMSPADRFEFRQGMREQAEKRRESLKAAAEKLLAALEEAQKEVARDVLPGLAGPGRGPLRSAGPGPREQQHRH